MGSDVVDASQDTFALDPVIQLEYLHLILHFEGPDAIGRMLLSAKAPTDRATQVWALDLAYESGSRSDRRQLSMAAFRYVAYWRYSWTQAEFDEWSRPPHRTWVR